MNPPAPGDAKLFATISCGEFNLNGFRNKDLRPLLFADPPATREEHRCHTAVVSRQIRLLRAHCLVRKVPESHRYHLYTKGRIVVAASISVRNGGIENLTQLAA